MQTFKNTADGMEWHFDEDVIVTQENGIYVFTAAHGAVLNTPSTLQPYIVPPPTAEAVAAAAKAEANRPIHAQIAALEAQQSPRAMREAALGLPGAVERLQTVQDQINTLAVQLIK